MKAIICLGLFVCAAGALAGEPKRSMEIRIHSSAFEGNLLGVSAERSVAVYLPPSYHQEKDRRYPVLYVLHGNRGAARNASDLLSLFGVPTLELMDALIAEGTVKEMIVVQPDGTHRYGGCQYANSTVTGNWADFIVRDLVEHVDRNFRTLATPLGRGLVGSSMGGRGVLDLSLKFPGVFGTVYAMFPGQMGFQRFPRSGDAEAWRKLILSKDSKSIDRSLHRLLGFAVAFSPNPKQPPLFADFPMTLEGDAMRTNADVMRRWAEFDPVEIAAKNPEPLRRLQALYFDCGTSDKGLAAVRLFSSILSEKNVPHVFEEYDGGHGDPGAVRFKSRVLPVLSKHLAEK